MSTQSTAHILDLPLELWNHHVLPAAGSAKMRLGSTCLGIYKEWKKSHADDYTATRVFQSISTENYMLTKDSIYPVNFEEAKKIYGVPIAAVKLPYHDRNRWLHANYQQQNYPFYMVIDKLEKVTYVWQRNGITFAKCLGVDPPNPQWEEVTFGKGIRNFDFFGPKLLVIGTPQSLFFLDRKTLKILKQYPYFTQIEKMKSDYAKGTITIDNTINIQKFSFLPLHANSQKPLLSTKARVSINKVNHVVNSSKAFFSNPMVTILAVTTFMLSFIFPSAIMMGPIAWNNIWNDIYPELSTAIPELMPIFASSAKISLVTTLALTSLSWTALVLYPEWLGSDYNE